MPRQPVLTLLLLLLGGLLSAAQAQPKTVYIPAYLRNPSDVNGRQFTMSKTQQSADFILIWGDSVGLNPATYPDASLRFNPAALLDTLETLYGKFKQLGFLNDSAGTHLAQYKIPIVLYGTWGFRGQQGFANGGDADGVIGAFWVHPAGMRDGRVAAHELTHSLQAEVVIDYRTPRGLGPVWNNAGIFWETHAQLMRNLIYPSSVTAWGMDQTHIEAWGDWKNTYENYALLLAIAQSEGLGMVSRFWRQSYSTEYPLQTYKRLAGYSQARFNDSLYRYARRMATYDFPMRGLGTWFRRYRAQDLQTELASIQATWTVLRAVPGSATRYAAPIELAPEEYGYNVIPLYLNPDSCGVLVRFRGQTGANPHTGWRYGFVAARPDGTVSRYGPTYGDATRELAFSLLPGEEKLYLVVMGAPGDAITTTTTNDTWYGYPKHFRHPYELTISGAVPEGFQNSSAFRPVLRPNGRVHPNGGGWVASTATVSASAYVGPLARVLGTAVVSGTARVEGTAVVRDSHLSGQARVQDNAFMVGGSATDSAVVRGQAFVTNATLGGHALVGMRARVSNYQLGGTVEVGGDVVVYNSAGACSRGVYYTLTNYYDNKLLPCDGRTANQLSNRDVNTPVAPFTAAAMALGCRCATLPACLSAALGTTAAAPAGRGLLALPNPATETMELRWLGLPAGTPLAATLYDALGRVVGTATGRPGAVTFDVAALPAGVYVVRAEAAGQWQSVRVVVVH